MTPVTSAPISTTSPGRLMSERDGCRLPFRAQRHASHLHEGRVGAADAAGRAGGMLRRPRLARRLMRGSGGVLVGFALAAER